MTEQRLQEIEDREKKAAAGPWDKTRTMSDHTALGGRTIIARVFSERFRDMEGEKANADFISHSRIDIPDLLAYVKVLKDKIDSGYWTEGPLGGGED